MNFKHDRWFMVGRSRFDPSDEKILRYAEIPKLPVRYQLTAAQASPRFSVQTEAHRRIPNRVLVERIGQ